MKIGIMQPYFIPYIGYWQLINAVDKYIIFDDVNYINRGWINRNRILVDGETKYFNISTIKASQNKKINEIQIDNNPIIISKKLRTIEYAYKKAPFYDSVFPLVENMLKNIETNLALYIENSIYTICNYLDIKTELYISSSLNKNNKLMGEKKILNICELFGATEYYNPIGGQALYFDQHFRDKGIELKFLETDDITYKQFNNVFQKNLSIIDVMMFNPKERVEELLHKYILK